MRIAARAVGLEVGYPLVLNRGGRCRPAHGLPSLEGRGRKGAPDGADLLRRAFRQGLKDTGYVEGENVTIEYRWAASTAREAVPLDVMTTSGLEMEGTVSRWIKIYGFITSDDGGPDVFVHSKNIVGRRELREGARVKFKTRDSSRKPGALEAFDVEPVELAP